MSVVGSLLLAGRHKLQLAAQATELLRLATGHASQCNCPAYASETFPPCQKRLGRTVGQEQDVVEEVVGLGRRLQQRDEGGVVLVVRRVRQELDDLVRRAAVQPRADLVQQQHLHARLIARGSRR